MERISVAFLSLAAFESAATHAMHAEPATFAMAFPAAPPAPGWLLVVSGFALGLLCVAARRMPMARTALGSAALFFSAACYAPVIPVPNTFQNNTPADANQVNQNFNEVVTQIADHADDSQLHPTSVDGLDGGTISGDVAVTGEFFAQGILSAADEVQAQGRIFSAQDVVAGGALVGTSVEIGGGATVEGMLSIGADGSFVLGRAGSGSSIALKPNGDIEIIGNNVTVTGGANVSVTAGQTYTATAGTDHNIQAGNATNVTSGGAVSIDGSTIDLNAP